MSLSGLYHPIILQHNEEPCHYRKDPEADIRIQAYNPLCGDRFTLYLRTNSEEVSQACFHGYGCAVSKASTSVLVKRLEGLSLRQAKELIETFYSYVQPGPHPGLVERDAEFEGFQAAREFPGRLKCATLAWDALKEFLTAKL